MIVSNPNPSRCESYQLERLQRDELNDEQAVLLAKHLEHCPACRKELDDSVVIDTDWERARSTVIDRIRHHSATRGTAQDSAPTNTAWLAWLQPYHEPNDPRTFIGILDSYPILRVLGTGGMGIVLEGWDRELHRPVAIKVMHWHLASIGVARQRFVREARCAASIVHTNVIAIHRINADHMPPYFVMPLIAGESLQERLNREGAIPVDQALRITAQVADGLSAAEKQGLIHRDVKPANILVEHGTDRALLTDFGLVRALDEATITQSGAIAGTPQYMSPEQASGESLDPRTDIYSLGAVLYAMLTGHPPFNDPSPLALVKKIVESDPKPITYYEPSHPKSVQVFVAWLMHKDRRKRAPHAADVARFATDIHANIINPVQFGLPAGIRTLMRHERWRGWGVSISLIALVTSVTLLLWARQPPQPTDESNLNKSQTLELLEQVAPEPAIWNQNGNPASQLDADREIRAIDIQLQLLEKDLLQDESQSDWEKIPADPITDVPESRTNH